jgi:hypothetical protein
VVAQPATSNVHWTAVHTNFGAIAAGMVDGDANRGVFLHAWLQHAKNLQASSIP